MHSVTNAIPTGTIASIPAKAHAHRALICAALANSPSTILLSRTSKDIDATMDSLRGLGAHVVYENKVVTVTPGPVPTKGNVVPHESGTTLRLLLPVAASICNEVDVDAKGRLPDRPLEPMLGEMKAHGVTFSQDKPPFTMTGRLQGGEFGMVGDVSSQFFSGLLLAASQCGGATITSTTPLQSSDYVTLTTTTMADFGVTVDHTPSSGTVQESFAVAANGKPITITGMNKNSVQADRRIMQVIIDAGCDVVWDGMNVTVTGRAVKPIHADLEQMPDMLPVMAALACSIHGESSFVKGARLRLKESDRLEAVANLVRDLGGTVREEGDDLYIIGSGILKGGQGDCVNDHRLVMAGTLMALISENPVTLKDSEAITKSYPDFFEDWNSL
ncbi:MAG: 3-phosphoshikimate 1-carboxyvinyltransferase, partial [Veillonella sp.]|nr:3-phosphoshikimate 1-carboxyvinyltransferase [Veillonella sp.]